jgi:hypothetical protein
MLDEVHPNHPTPLLSQIAYTLGRVGDHNVILTCLSAGGYSSVPAAAVVSHLQSIFPNVRYGLIVVIGGGVSSNNCYVPGSRSNQLVHFNESIKTEEKRQEDQHLTGLSPLDAFLPDRAALPPTRVQIGIFVTLGRYGKL